MTPSSLRIHPDIYRKDNGRDFFYVANPAAVLMSSWVDANFPPEAYGTMDAQMSEQVLHAANTRFLLPYVSSSCDLQLARSGSQDCRLTISRGSHKLIGSARVEGKAYVADQLAYPRVSPLWLSVMLAVVCKSSSFLVALSCSRKAWCDRRR